MVQLLCFNLKKAGFAVATAANGFEALRKACSIGPDLILLDVMMPDLDGFVVCEILRHDPLTSATPVLMVTAVSSELAKFSGLESGANEYIRKPFSPRELVSRVEAILGCEASGTKLNPA